jgi:hypothetical protein
MKRSVACVLVALGGCDQVFGLSGRDAAVDAAPDVVDAPPGTCDLGAPSTAYPIPSKGAAIVAGRFDAGDSVDVAVATTGVSRLMIRYNSGGSFLTANDLDIGGAALALATGDVNADGLDDIAVARSGVSMALLQTVTSWDPRTVDVAGGVPRTIAIANFDEVGLADLLVAIPTGQLAQLLLGGQTMYTPGTSIPTLGNAVDGVAVNLDTDGDLDIVVAYENINGIQIYRDTGANFEGEAPISTGMKPRHVAAARLGDRVVIDLVVVNEDSDNLVIVRNDGNGGFSPTTAIAVGDGPRGLVLADVNGDGFTDIVTTSNKENSLTLLRGTQDGFELRADYPTVAKPTALAVADFTGDGRLDVAVLAEDDGFVIHPTECTSP